MGCWYEILITPQNSYFTIEIYLENSQTPLLKLNSDSACTTIEYNLRDSRSLAGGCLNGKVCVWDARSGGNAQLLTEIECSHHECVKSLLWIHSKSNTEFYSGSADGQIYWWDTRRFDQPISSLICDPERTDNQNLYRSYGCSVLEYEYTMPTKYLMGTEKGWVFSGNRKGTTPIEKITQKIQCHEGPIRSLERNPTYCKNFMTVGDFRIKIWSEDCKDNPIIWTRNNDYKLTCGTWSRTRFFLNNRFLHI